MNAGYALAQWRLVVVALANGAGVSDELYGGQNGQRIQIPVLPSGDWVLPNGVDAVLGPNLTAPLTCSTAT